MHRGVRVEAHEKRRLPRWQLVEELEVTFQVWALYHLELLQAKAAGAREVVAFLRWPAEGLFAVEVSQERRQSTSILLIGDPAAVVALASQVDEGLEWRRARALDEEMELAH